LFGEIAALLVPGGLLYVSEPLFVVNGREFRRTVSLAERAGFGLVEEMFSLLNRAAVLRKR